MSSLLLLSCQLGKLLFIICCASSHRTTYEMGSRTGFNDRLADRTKRFTYFVPRNKAWQNSEDFYPQALQKLVSGDYLEEVINNAKIRDKF